VPYQLQHNRTVAFVIAQQYSSTNCVSLSFHFREEKIARAFQKYLDFLYCLKKYVHLKLRNSEGVCSAMNVWTFNL
jgi:hypothetical protein